MLTETQFRAEQAVLAGYEALTSGSYADKIENGKVTDSITISGIGTIGEGSFIDTTSAVRGGDIPVTMEIIFTPEDSSEAITVSITGSAANGETLEGFTADTYTATTGNETKEFDSTPSVFIAKNSNDEILDMINAYIDGSETGEFTVDEEASFINGNNPSWIVFTNLAIDSATHKVNFTPVDGTVSTFSLDDCLDVSETDVTISDAPAYKSEGLSKEDQDALEIGLEYLAYASLFHGTDQTESKQDYDEQYFFDEPKTLDITITVNGDSYIIDIEDDTQTIHMAFTGLNGDIRTGTCTEFSIDNENYSYLRDSLYQRYIALYCSVELLPTIIMIPQYAAQEDIPGIEADGNTYKLTNVDFYDTLFNGTITQDISGGEETNYMEMSFTVNLSIDDKSGLAPIQLESSGIYALTSYGEDDFKVGMSCSYVNMPGHGGESTSTELDIFNRCLDCIVNGYIYQ